LGGTDNLSIKMSYQCQVSQQITNIQRQRQQQQQQHHRTPPLLHIPNEDYYQQQPQYPPMAGQAQPVYAQPMNSSQGMGMGTGVQNVPCARCGSVYPLPVGSTSWRCKQCQSMNGGGLGCIIL